MKILLLQDDAGGARRVRFGDGRERIDLLLTDVVMPGSSGKELADELAGVYPEMTVLYMSGYTEHSIVRDGRLDPGTEFLEKPFRPDELVQRVREVLDRSAEAAP